jgi:norsolorinic acid ketoreductase
LYLARPNNIVVAAVRDPASESSRSLLKVKTGAGSKVILVKIDSTSETDPKDAVRELQDRHCISHLDVVIANAGVENNVAPVKDVSVDELYKVIAVNGIGPILLFQAALPLLERSPKTPIFAPMGSMMGSIGGMESVPFRGAAYGPSKAMLNWITRKIQFEHENLIAVVMDPG